MKIFYSDPFTYPLPEGHTFPAEKYARLRFELLSQGVLAESELLPSPLAESWQILLAHSTAYYQACNDGMISNKILRQLGLPWSKELIVRAQRGIGGVIEGARSAMQMGFAGALSGGTHHAHREEGRGFCVFNDTAVAALTLLQDKDIHHCAVIDLDAHQGNGTAEILGDLDEIFILDMHGQKSYPVRKIPTDLDIALPENVGDTEYLEKLAAALPVVAQFQPDLIFYIAGVDPLQGDRFGKMALSQNGLMERDRLVFRFAKKIGTPVVTSMGGGYGNPISLTVQAHTNTYRVAKEVFEI